MRLIASLSIDLRAGNITDKQPRDLMNPAAFFGSPGHRGRLTTTVEQVEQARFASWPVEVVLLLQRQQGHPPTLCRERGTDRNQGLSLQQQKIKPLIAHRFPLVEAKHAQELLGKEGVAEKLVIVPGKRELD